MEPKEKQDSAERIPSDRKFAGIRKSLDFLMAALLLWALSQVLLFLTP